MMNFRVTLVVDYVTDEPIDADELHDAIRESFDNIDLEFDTEVTVWDDEGEDTGETRTVNVNGERIVELQVNELPE
jgi:hypothetical protein